MKGAIDAAQGVAHLLALLRDPRHARALCDAEWDVVVRLGRQARLLGVLYHRLASGEAVLDDLAPHLAGHFLAARNYAEHRRHHLGQVVDALGAALPAGMRVVLLKGAAYAVQGMQAADGRMPSDVDVMVAQPDLARAEAALLAAGWQFQQDMDAHDERYYREWSHELPPLRLPGQVLEVDLHHAIAPVTARRQPTTAALFDAARALPGQRWWVLHPHDQIIHAAIHVFQDSDLVGRLRDIVDIDALVRGQIDGDADWQALVARARLHRAEAALGYALLFCQRWLGLAVPPGLIGVPPTWAARLTVWAFSTAAPPGIPDEPVPAAVRWAARYGTCRYYGLRMPPSLLLRHAAVKLWRGLRGRLLPARQPGGAAG